MLILKSARILNPLSAICKCNDLLLKPYHSPCDFYTSFVLHWIHIHEMHKNPNNLVFKLRIAQTDNFLVKLTSHKWTQGREETSFKNITFTHIIKIYD